MGLQKWKNQEFLSPRFREGETFLHNTRELISRKREWANYRALQFLFLLIITDLGGLGSEKIKCRQSINASPAQLNMSSHGRLGIALGTHWSIDEWITPTIVFSFFSFFFSFIGSHPPTLQEKCKLNIENEKRRQAQSIFWHEMVASLLPPVCKQDSRIVQLLNAVIRPTMYAAAIAS
jgi:hypothetical protein